MPLTGADFSPRTTPIRYCKRTVSTTSTEIPDKGAEFLYGVRDFYVRYKATRKCKRTFSTTLTEIQAKGTEFLYGVRTNTCGNRV